VLNCWVIETKETLRRSKTSTSLAKSDSARAGQPVDLIDDHDVDASGLDVGDQPFQGWPLHRAARIAAVVIAGQERSPPFVLLRQDEGGAGFTLGVERVEGLIEAFLGRFARVDRATSPRDLAARLRRSAIALTPP
jgi:hypothetical protein